MDTGRRPVLEHLDPPPPLLLLLLLCFLLDRSSRAAGNRHVNKILQE